MNPESSMYRVLDSAVNLVLLNFLILLTSIPLATIGLALRAGYQSLADIKKGQDTRIVGSFVKRLRAGWDATATWGLLLGVVLVGCIVEWMFLNRFEASPGSFDGLGILIMKSGIVSGALIISIITMWMYANVSVLSRIGKNLVATISVSVRTAVQHAEVTFLLAVVAWFPVVMLFIFPQQWAAIGGYLVLFGVTLPGYIAVLHVAK